MSKRARRLVVGDVHGAFRALTQVLKRAGFDPSRDRLISCGDLVDRGPEIRETLEYCESLPYFDHVLGNHDAWARSWVHGDIRMGEFRNWFASGGERTINALGGEPEDSTAFRRLKTRWGPFFDRAVRYLDLGDALVLHAGFDPDVPLAETSDHVLQWQRYFALDLLRNERWAKVPAGYRAVVIGHTIVSGELDTVGPFTRDNVWMIDQGAGAGGPLTLLDIDSMEWWQSDRVSDLYPEHGYRFRKTRRPARCWLMKSEPDVYSIEDLEREGTTLWTGVRNFQARNLMRDQMRKHDHILFYHSNAKPSGVAGLARVVETGLHDPTALDPDDAYYDPKATAADPRWSAVRIKFEAAFEEVIPLSRIKEDPALAGMLLTGNSRLSVQPVEREHFNRLRQMGVIIERPRVPMSNDF